MKTVLERLSKDSVFLWLKQLSQVFKTSSSTKLYTCVEPNMEIFEPQCSTHKYLSIARITQQITDTKPLRYLVDEK